MRRTLTKAPVLLAAFDFFWLVLGAGWFRGVRGIPVLRDVEVRVPAAYPSLSVLVPARRGAFGKSMRSMLAQDYAGPCR